jgi:hypothetical protein
MMGSSRVNRPTGPAATRSAAGTGGAVLTSRTRLRRSPERKLPCSLSGTIGAATRWAGHARSRLPLHSSRRLLCQPQKPSRPGRGNHRRRGSVRSRRGGVSARRAATTRLPRNSGVPRASRDAWRVAAQSHGPKRDFAQVRPCPAGSASGHFGCPRVWRRDAVLRRPRSARIRHRIQGVAP